jgi:hypothetical protein
MTSQSLDYTKKAFQLTALSLALALSGCGGGSTVDSVAPAPGTGGNGNTGNNGNNNGDGNGDGEVAETLNISALTLLDTNGDMTRVVSGLGATASVKVTDAKGNGVSGALVTFNGEGVKFGTTNGAVLTNTDGVASISVMPSSITDTGSYSLTASASFKDNTASTGTYNYSLQSVNIVLDNLQVGESTLESGSSTILTLETKDTVTNQFQNDVSVNFTTTCGTFENSNVISSNQGNVSTTYNAIDSNGNLCEGKQTLTAVTANNTTTVKRIDINIKSIKASSIVYTTSNSVVLGAKNSGSSSSGQIEFTVYSNGRPAANQLVELDLVKSPIDLSFISQGNRDTTSLKSDALGKVTVNLYPGNIPGPVEIKATLKSNESVFALAKNIAVATGRPTQKGISLAVEKNVLSANYIDSTSVSIYLTDRQGNFVPDGTVVSFVAEGGTITPNCATTNGRCSATFTSQNPRPSNGRASVIAYVEGDKAYTDIDGDNAYTAGIDKLLDNIGDFFRDDNEDLKYNPGEFVYRKPQPTNLESTKCAISTLFQPNIPNFNLPGTTNFTECDNGLSTVLRAQLIMGFADETPTFAKMVNSAGGISFELYGNSMQTVSMPSETSLSLSVEDKTPDNELDCNAEFISGELTVPRLVSLQRVDGTTGKNLFESSKDVRYEIEKSGCVNGDVIKLTVTTPTPSSKSTTVRLF